jgi:hypothetical protein
VQGFWDTHVKEDLRKMRISGWRGKARRRDEWKSILREVKVLQGPWRRRVVVVAALGYTLYTECLKI